jgi:hypothetical protein
VESYLKEFCAEGLNSAGGQDWILPFTYRRVRRKLGDKFGAPEHAFYALDDDDSGSLTRAEVGVGLQAVGIRLNSNELSELVDQLDLDGGGKIEVEEVPHDFPSQSPFPSLPLVLLPYVHTRPSSSSSQPYQGLAIRDELLCLCFFLF